MINTRPSLCRLALTINCLLHPVTIIFPIISLSLHASVKPFSATINKSYPTSLSNHSTVKWKNTHPLSFVNDHMSNKVTSNNNNNSTAPLPLQPPPTTSNTNHRSSSRTSDELRLCVRVHLCYVTWVCVCVRVWVLRRQICDSSDSHMVVASVLVCTLQGDVRSPWKKINFINPKKPVAQT